MIRLIQESSGLTEMEKDTVSCQLVREKSSRENVYYHEHNN